MPDVADNLRQIMKAARSLAEDKEISVRVRETAERIAGLAEQSLSALGGAPDQGASPKEG